MRYAGAHEVGDATRTSDATDCEPRPRSSGSRALRATTFVASLLLFGAADVLRTSAVRAATMLSMAGWIAFGVLFLAWAWRGVDAGTALRQSARVATLTLVSFGVLLAYYLRSRLIETGPHTDAVYTFMGLRAFVALDNPITFAGRTPSFPQAALMLLLHLPGVAVGFDALGPLAVPLGAIVHLALLFGVMADLLVDGSVAAKCAAVALASGMYSNRLLILTYDITGYAFPAVCLALMFLVAVDDRTDAPSRVIGGLLAVALLHHYPGFFMVLPLCVAWLVLARTPWRRVRRFVAENPVVLAVLLMLASTLLTHPELMLTRVRDVTTGPNGVDALREKVRGNWVFVEGLVPLIRHQFFAPHGSWFLLNVPPLGGLVVPLVAGAWVVSIATAARRIRFLLVLAALAIALAVLTVVQDLVTDFSDYRQFPMLFALATTSLAFVFRLPRVGPMWRALAVVYAVTFGLYNYADLASFHGARHGVETAFRSQAAMEGVWRFVGRPDAVRRLGIAEIVVVVDPFFPLESLYLEAVTPKAGVPVTTTAVAAACPRGHLAIDDVSRRSCAAFLLVANAQHCDVDRVADASGVAPRISGYVFAPVCDKPRDERAGRAVVAVDVGSGP